jgi:hypothetical protein
MSPRELPSDEVTSRLRQRVRDLDESIPIPAGLVERVLESPPTRVTASRRWSTIALVIATTLGIIVGGAFVGWWANRTQERPSRPVGGQIVITVYNAEKPCQRLRTIECGLAVNADPHVPTADKVVDRAWHGERLIATCVVPDGKAVTDEEGVRSPRWYRVTTPRGVTGYLPGVRTRNTQEVTLCPRLS